MNDGVSGSVLKINQHAQVVGGVKCPAIPGCELRVEAIRAVFAFEPVQVCQLAFARELDPLAGQDFPGHDVFGVLTGDGGIGFQ